MSICILCKNREAHSTGFRKSLYCLECGHLRDVVVKHLHRAKVEGLPATLTVEEWYQILIDFDWHCAYCQRKLEFFGVRLEHYIPISMGGGTTRNNVVPSCKHCDSQKRCDTINHPPGYERVGNYLASLE